MTHFNQPKTDEVRVMRGLVTVLLFCITVAGAMLAVRSGNPLLMAGFIALPFAIMLMHRPQETFVLALVLDATQMPVPGMSYTTLGLLAKVLLIVVFALSLVMGRRPWQGEKLAEKNPLFCFAALIALLMAVRGSGLRMLGSATWGGMIYIVLMIGIFFFLTVNGLRISGKQIRWVVWGSLIAGVIGSFLQLTGWDVVEEGIGVGATRLTWLLPLASALFPLVFALKFKRSAWISALLLLVCLSLVGLTGFRSRLVAFIMIAAAYGFFKARNKIKYAAVMGLLGVFVWVGVILISPALPLGLQRAVSFVPGAHVDYRTAQDAAGSIDWRVEIWGYCLSQAKQYLWIGRGSAFNVWETAGNLGVSDVQTYSPWFAFETRSYHSGPLSLLVDYGIPGLLIALWLTGVVLKRFWKLAQWLAGIDTFESRYALFLCTTLIWQWVAFYLVYGDMRGFAHMIAQTAAAAVIAGSVFLIEKEEPQQADEQGLS